jgi:hypothetical protein
MRYIFMLLTVLQLALTTLATHTIVTPLQARQAKQGRLKPTNNNTWIIYDAQYSHPGPALKPRVDNVGAISFSLRRSVWERNPRGLSLTFVPVPENKAVSCSYGQLDPVVKSDWRQCDGYSMDGVPPGDEDMLGELNKRLRFRLSNLKTSPSGNFGSVSMEIVNHIAPKK